MAQSSEGVLAVTRGLRVGTPRIQPALVKVLGDLAVLSQFPHLWCSGYSITLRQDASAASESRRAELPT